MLISLNSQSKHVFYIAVRLNTKEFIEALFESTQALLPSDDLKKVLRTNELNGINLFHVAAVNSNLGIVGCVFKIVSQVLGKDAAVSMLKEVYFEQSMNVFHILMQNENFENLESFFLLVSAHHDAKVLIMTPNKHGETAVDIAKKSKNVEKLGKYLFLLNNLLRF
jgi:hypothetical protein